MTLSTGQPCRVSVFNSVQTINTSHVGQPLAITIKRNKRAVKKTRFALSIHERVESVYVGSPMMADKA